LGRLGWGKGATDINPYTTSVRFTPEDQPICTSWPLELLHDVAFEARKDVIAEVQAREPANCIFSIHAYLTGRSARLADRLRIVQPVGIIRPEVRGGVESVGVDSVLDLHVRQSPTK